MCQQKDYHFSLDTINVLPWDSTSSEPLSAHTPLPYLRGFLTRLSFFKAQLNPGLPVLVRTFSLWKNNPYYLYISMGYLFIMYVYYSIVCFILINWGDNLDIFFLLVIGLLHCFITQNKKKTIGLFHCFITQNKKNPFLTHWHTLKIEIVHVVHYLALI